ncbi:unnamed protein product [Schistosoma bovis]|nr:unnamed protein product [Schistosoma bovis]CAH8567192.1 unnamed protein product [Schistosoma bovis]CAH8573422.1 unnamed protein product [Schistosoma haematobium]CAH8580582.1 unnamed protein product [Schistosoma haematobium]
MNRMPSAVASGGSQPLHMQPVHSGPVISSSLNLPNTLPPGMLHSGHGIQMSGPHDREPATPASGSGPIPGHYFSTLGMNPGSPHPIPNMVPHGHPSQFHHHPLLSLNRLPHLIGQPELRIFEMNKRLQQRSDDCDSLWWESFATDFFEDDATLTLAFLTEEGPKSYTIGRTLIPRYFRSIFESGCGELYYNLRLNHEYFHHPILTLDSESATMTMTMVRSIPVTVVVEGRLTLDFAFDDLMRIRSWIFLIRTHREMIMRSMLGIQDPAFLDQLSKNITRYGMTNTTLNFFRLCIILEPMQELMSRQKAYSLTPRDCLKTTLFQKWQRMMPQEATRQPSKRRKRKGSSATTEGANNTSRTSKRKQSPIPLQSHHIAQPGDVMIVGEPTLMGGDFGDEDERLITRLENTQYDAVAAAAANSGVMASHINSGPFPGSGDSPAGIISSPLGLSSGGNMLNSNQPQQQINSLQFRAGPMSSGGSNQSMPHEGVFPGNLTSLQQNQPVSMPPSQSFYSSSAPNRNLHHHSQMMGQQFMPVFTKAQMSASNMLNRGDHYMPSGNGDAMHQPTRSSSASSLVDGTNGLSGFPHCASPSLLPSRPPARFTPPSLPNGLSSSVVSSQQSSFMMPNEVMGSGGTQMGHVSVPGTPLTSPLTSSSFAMDMMDNQNVLHSAPSTLISTTIKSNNSPMLYNSIGTSCSGNQSTPESIMHPTISGIGCDVSSAVMNDNEDLKMINNNGAPSRPTAAESM